MITNASGNSVVKLSFSAYGERRDADWDGPITSSHLTSAANVTRHGYTDHLHLDSVKLVHMGGRVYDPGVGRFLSRDPYIDGVQSSQGANGYAYVWNNPLTRWDPTGYSGVGVIYRIWCNSGDCSSSIELLEEVVVTASRWIFEPLSRLGDINVGGIDAGAGGESGGGGSSGGGAGAPEGSKEEEPEEKTSPQCAISLPFPSSEIPRNGGFGPRNIQDQVPGSSTFHLGVDFAVPIGTPVPTVYDGKVVRADRSATLFGNTVIVNNGASTSGGTSYSLYAHLSVIAVAKGQSVSAGDTIGLSGNNTGNGQRVGPHLHYGLADVPVGGPSPSSKSFYGDRNLWKDPTSCP
jgi:RHS repeat-associated protein